MRELIFNITDVFNDKTAEGCLSQYEATHYHIPAYQRGYKWAVGPGEPVTVLLNDLWSSYKKHEDEYYLQYITVKPIHDQKCLEVIDGQQRLTTLSILLSVISYRLQGPDSADVNMARGKLDYAVRGTYFAEHIYEPDNLKALVETPWVEYIADDEENLNRQDIFYIHAAACEINSFLEEQGGDLSDFFKYLTQHIKLIVNSVERHIPSETVFRNLNSNKVPLTEIELIKGVILTRAGRQRVTDSSRFREVLEMRVLLGKEWESIQQWVRRPEIDSFYFNKSSNGMHELITISAMLHNKKEFKEYRRTHKGMTLFDYVNQLSNVNSFFELLVDVKRKLNSWFKDSELYHLIGFCRVCRGTQYNNSEFLLDCLNQKTYTELKDLLNRIKHGLVYGKKEIEISTLSYEQDKDRLHAILLALSVFYNGRDATARFDFDTFTRQEWSLEHIFPQHPEGRKQEIKDEHKKAILELIGSSPGEVKEILSLPSRTEEQRQIYETALAQDGGIHGIGNMCLLSSADNSALSNLFFKEKREVIMGRIRRGSFVPKHTFDVFSKMITKGDDNLKLWTAKDMEEHARHIATSLASIMEEAQ